VVNLAGGQLSYQGKRIPAPRSFTNTVATVVGGQYRLVLSDGTAVWLDASAAEYPTAFRSQPRSGADGCRGYFEVAHQNKPLSFITQDMDVHDLGTS